MKAEFWHERWQNDQLGFHQSEINGLLVEYWPTLPLPSPEETPVFVPLCGKSLDMRWLRDRGHPVIGVDLSPIAIRDFFAEAGILPTVSQHGPLERSQGGGFDLYAGDFFLQSAQDLASVGACYDRASLIALPPEMRVRYAKHLTTILPDSVTILLITLEYDQTKIDGPPHSVPPAEVESLYSDSFEIETLTSSGWVDADPRFRERGLAQWLETVWRLSRGAHATGRRR